jgi:Trk K+ transport system NAD-binding subunit
MGQIKVSRNESLGATVNLVKKRKHRTGPRRLMALRRDLRVFAYLFPWRVAIFLAVALTIATAVFMLAHYQVYRESLHPIAALFAIINMTFFQLNYEEMPRQDFLIYFPVVVPLIGLPLFSFFGLKVIHIIRVFFVRGERGQEWQEALIESTVTNHILICGLGRIGYRVAKTLRLDYRQPVVGINDTSSALVDELMADGMPVILGDTEHEDVLKKAGVERAKVVIACTNRDWVNVETVVRVRRLNRRARIVLRLFEDELEEDIKTNFKVDAVISRSAAAALSFTYAAIGGRIMESFELADKNYVLAQVPLETGSPMLGRTIGELAEEQDVTVVCHHHGSKLSVEPNPNTRLVRGDNLFVFTTVDQMIKLIERGVQGSQQNPPCKGPILVCGLGHTGYRISTNLLALGCQVVALDFEGGRLSGRLSELGIPVIFGDLRWSTFLTEAGVKEATAIVSCTEDDMMNLQIALRARQLNPKIRVVMRIFNDELNEQLRQTFGVNSAYSTSALASPDFVSAALNRMNVRFVDIEHLPQVIVRLQVNLSSLYGTLIADLQQEEDLTVLLHTRDGQVSIPPNLETRLRVGDEILVLITEDKLGELNRRNQPTYELQTEGYG